MEICVEKGCSVKPNLELGGYGEHFSEPRSIAFAHQLGMDYVRCSP
jgi:pyruvate,orthophosphate dikinase